ncbi:hypothetical protein Tco_0674970 [Tanacetum coccineum]
MTKIQNTQANIQSDIASLKKDTSKIKDIMTEIFSAVKGQPFSTPLSSVPKPTLAITGIQANVGGEFSSHCYYKSIERKLFTYWGRSCGTAKKEPEVTNVKKEPEHETQDIGPIPITVFRPTTKPTLEAETEIIGSSSRPQLTDPIVEDPNAPVVIPYEINGVFHYLTNEQIQAHIDEEENLEKAVREARVSKPELIKVVHEVAKEAGVDPKAL